MISSSHAIQFPATQFLPDEPVEPHPLFKYLEQKAPKWIKGMTPVTERVDPHEQLPTTFKVELQNGAIVPVCIKPSARSRRRLSQRMKGMVAKVLVFVIERKPIEGDFFQAMSALCTKLWNALHQFAHKTGLLKNPKALEIAAQKMHKHHRHAHRGYVNRGGRR